MVRKDIQMFGLLIFFLFSVVGFGTADRVRGVSATSCDVNNGSSTCNFPEVFNFGDSNSNTGGISAAFYPIGIPNGETFFGKPTGRASVGRLSVDFMYVADYLHYCCCNGKVVVNGTVYDGPCEHPKPLVSWEGIDLTEEAYQWVANYILDINSSMSDTSIPNCQACQDIND